MRRSDERAHSLAVQEIHVHAIRRAEEIPAPLCGRFPASPPLTGIPHRQPTSMLATLRAPFITAITPPPLSLCDPMNQRFSMGVR